MTSPKSLDASEALRRWLAKADGDLRVAKLIRAAEPEALPSIAGFHAQQAVEKYLKSLLVARGQEPPRVHSITRIWEQIDAFPPMGGLPLTRYAVLDRYPRLEDATTDEPAWSEIDGAIRYAESVREAVIAVIDPGGELAERVSEG
jgi:HEPN domain-containing protein